MLMMPGLIFGNFFNKNMEQSMLTMRGWLDLWKLCSKTLEQTMLMVRRRLGFWNFAGKK